MTQRPSRDSSEPPSAQDDLAEIAAFMLRISRRERVEF